MRHPSEPLTRLHKIDTSLVGDRVRPRNKPRGIPPALEPRLVHESNDPASASMVGFDLFGPHHLAVDGNLAEFNATLHAVLLREVTLAHLDYGTEVTITVNSLPDDYLVIVPASGHATVQLPGHRIESSPILAVVAPRRSPLTIACGPATAHVLLRIERRALDLHLARLLGRSLDEPLRLEPALDLAAPAASRWNFAVQMFHAELFDTESLLHAGVGVGQLEEFLMSALLYSQPSNYSGSLGPRVERQPHRAVRQATGYIDAHLREPITLADIADAAGVSVRTLQSAFRSDLDLTPMAFLRERRLDRTRAALADAVSADRPTVGSIASAWGFSHLGRFAVAYRDRFGESPSETLRR